MSKRTEPNNAETKPKLKGVLIIGPNTNIEDDIRREYQKSGYLILGDGKNLLNREDITKALEGRMQAGTRVDIVGHGDIDPITRKHGIEICHSFLDLGHSTGSLFRTISKAAGDIPLETHVWSCFGGRSARDASDLPKGSCVIAHGSENKSIFQHLAKNGIRESIAVRREITPPPLDYQQIVDNLHIGCEQKCFVGISGVKGRSAFRIPTMGLKSLEGVNDTFLRFANGVFDQAKKLGALKGIKAPEKDHRGFLEFKQLGGETKVANIDKTIYKMIGRAFNYRCLEGKSEVSKLLKSDPRELEILQKSSEVAGIDPVAQAVVNKRTSLTRKLLKANFKLPDISYMAEQLSDTPKKFADFLAVARETGRISKVDFTKTGKNGKTPQQVVEVLPAKEKVAINRILEKEYDAVPAVSLTKATNLTRGSEATVSSADNSMQTLKKPSLVDMMRQRLSKGGTSGEVVPSAPAATPTVAKAATANKGASR